LSVRCFIAVEVDDPSTLDGITRVQSSLNATGANLKLVERENLHLTMKFLGDVRAGLLPEVVKVVSKTSFEPFMMALRGVGVFPTLRRPRVVWAGITEGVEELSAIFRDIEPRLVELDFKPESRSFSPHITIARVRSERNRDNLIEEVMTLEDTDFGGFEARHVKLKKSVLTPRGPIYTDLALSQDSGKA
jgi:2'-5' RNA ligase